MTSGGQKAISSPNERGDLVSHGAVLSPRRSKPAHNEPASLWTSCGGNALGRRHLSKSMRQKMRRREGIFLRCDDAWFVDRLGEGHPHRVAIDVPERPRCRFELPCNRLRWKRSHLADHVGLVVDPGSSRSSSLFPHDISAVSAGSEQDL
ncbi:hypothetical protein BV25DRAFT_1825809 [Artomyces pyxidatus]|uniref:Uncharacterized protein n=1 Tax=Artomyces pyxidatus TaxID=48021 RepID=A0ACB8T1H8_9AGAM|nr:hypothetical protein BV25DRAFT_1825809 [Artomyces pyxidatus]